MTERDPDGERRSANDHLEAAADMVRPATVDPHIAADLVHDAEAHRCIPNGSLCDVCEVRLEQGEGRRV